MMKLNENIKKLETRLKLMQELGNNSDIKLLESTIAHLKALEGYKKFSRVEAVYQNDGKVLHDITARVPEEEPENKTVRAWLEKER